VDETTRGNVYHLADTVPVIGHIRQYAAQVRDLALRRGIIRAAQEIVDEAYDNLDADEVHDTAENQLAALRRQDQKDGPVDITVLVQAAEARIYDARHGKRSCGRRTNFTGLNQLIGGLEQGATIVLAARPSIGKSAMAMNLASHVAVDERVLFFSVEMSKDELVDRLLANTSGVGLSKIRGGEIDEEEAARLFNAAQTLAKLHLSIDDEVSTMAEIVRRSRSRAAKESLGLIVIDYLQLLNAGGGRSESRQLEIGAMSRSTKLLARELRVPILVLSQLNRPDNRYGSEDSKQPIPQLSSLRDSGTIEQDADMVLFLHKPYLEDNEDVHLMVAKARNAQCGKIHLKFVPHTLTFMEKL